MTEHIYPSEYGRGVDKDLDAVWDLLDMIKPGVIHDDVRCYLAGAVRGLLARARKEERDTWRNVRNMRR